MCAAPHAQGQPRVCLRPAVLGRVLLSLCCYSLVLWLQFRHLLQTVSLKGMCSWVLFHFYLSDVWSGSFSVLEFLCLNLPSLLARRGRNVQILKQMFNRNVVGDFVIFLIHLVRGPEVESFATNRGFQLNKSKYRENWAIENHIDLCKVVFIPFSATWWHGLGTGSSQMWSTQPFLPSVYHSQCIRVENLLHVSTCV